MSKAARRKAKQKEKERIVSKLRKKKNEVFKSNDLSLSPLELKISSIFLGDMSLDYLEKYKDHRRLKVFYHKGTKCAFCSKEGVRLIKRMDNGSIHVDLYTADLTLMTVDHIIPKSFGGDMSLDNLRPMCKICNNQRQTTMLGDELELFLGVPIH
jgi:5-methylcytosine-specific restriction endonuclease McrA